MKLIFKHCSDLVETYQWNSWDHNGPYSFQRVMKKICKEQDLSKVVNQSDKCRGVHIHPPNRFYPLFGFYSLKFFEPKDTDFALNATKNILGFHFWNSHSKDRNITMGNGTATAFEKIAKKHCPRIYAENSSF